VTLAPGANFLVDINGTTPGTGYDRLVQTAGGINTFSITNSNLVVTVGTTLSVGQQFLIGQKTSAGSINGQFAQGSTVVGSDGTVFSISYTGGNGNDIVLTVTQAATATPTPTPTPAGGNFSWTGSIDTTWSTSGNWSPSVGAPPGALDTALFNGAFSNQPNVTLSRAVGTLHMTDSVAQNVTLSSNAAAVLTISGLGILGTGVLIDNTNAFTLTITARVGVDASQAWTNNSGNLFTVSGTTLALGEDNNLAVNGTGNTLISAQISDTGAMGSGLTKGGSGTLTLTTANTYKGGTTVIGGTLLVDNRVHSGTGTGDVTVNGAGTTLGGTGIISGDVTVNIGANLAPGNGGHTTSILTVGTVTLAPGANFLVDINGTTPGTEYDRLVQTAGGNNTFVITNSNLVVTVGTTLSVGQQFLIGQRTAGGPINGQFAQGNTVTGSDGTVFLISYTGGPGANDIVLTVVQVAASPRRPHVSAVRLRSLASLSRSAGDWESDNAALRGRIFNGR
jgi:autotransporter-associated beta strand protein